MSRSHTAIMKIPSTLMEVSLQPSKFDKQTFGS